jgi:hypothetical protein
VGSEGKGECCKIKYPESFKVSHVQFRKVSKFQSFKKSHGKLQSFKASKFQRFNVPKFQSYKISMEAIGSF